jgi:replication fork protection complex subunit Csm3/Swi3
MLNMYQLWLDDLYPRAKFADGLAMIEKLGHSKRIQYMRKEWIDESKPKRSAEDSDDEDADAHVSATVAATDSMEGIQSDQRAQEANPVGQDEGSNQPRPEPAPATSDAAEPDEDELDALLAGEAGSNPLNKPATQPLQQREAAEQDAFADEMDAMADMDDFW